LGSGNNGDKNRTWNAIEAEITNNVNNDGSDMGIRINPTYGYCYKLVLLYVFNTNTVLNTN
jgi:hypothetical protein